MTNRRKPAQRSTSTDWKPPRPRSELIKAIGGGGGVVVLTVLLIFLMKPADSTSGTPASVPATTQTQPAVSPSQPSGSTTTPSQP